MRPMTIVSISIYISIQTQHNPTHYIICRRNILLCLKQFVTKRAELLLIWTET